MVATSKKPMRSSSGSHKISKAAFKRIEKAVANPPKAGAALKAFVRRGELLLKKG